MRNKLFYFPRGYTPASLHAEVDIHIPIHMPLSLSIQSQIITHTLPIGSSKATQQDYKLPHLRHHQTLHGLQHFLVQVNEKEESAEHIPYTSSEHIYKWV